MRNILAIILFSLFSSFVFAASDNTLGWKTYLSYNNTNNVEESADQVFVVAEGALYTYGKEDNSIKQYYKGNGLNGTDIQFISYNKQTKSLLIIYSDYNMDIMKDGSVKNLPYLSTTTSLRDKDINSVMLYNEYAYLSLKSGIIVVNMDKNEITDTYNLSRNITSSAILNNHIYATTKEDNSTGVIYASLNDNLLDKSNWKAYTIPGFPSENSIDKIVFFKDQLFYLVKNKGVYYESNNTTVPLVSNTSMSNIKVTGEKLACIATSQVYLFTDTKTFDRIDNLSIKDISTYQTDKYWIAEGSKGLRSIKRTGSNQFEAVNEAIILDGPYSNSPFRIVCQNDKVYMIPGGKNIIGGTRFGKAGSVMIYDYNKWTVIEPSKVQSQLKIWPRDYTSIVVNTDDAGNEIIYTSSFGDGIVQYKNGEPVIVYDEKNSPIENAENHTTYYCFMDGLAFDMNGNLWMTNSKVNNNAIKILDKDGKWHSLFVESLRDKYTISNILITSNNDKWINIPRPTSEVRITVIADNNSLDEATSHYFANFTDTDGNDFSPSSYTCIKKKKNGYVWVGSNKGAVYFTNPKIAASDNYQSTRCTRVKLINEDGTPYYFLDNVMVSTIKVDNGNRKWIGTEGNGVYVLNEDNQEVVHQFNTSNSPLLSDVIYSIDINEKTGEVFIGTDKGLVSYKGEATEGRSDYSDVYAYPNPVRPEYRDKVTITGLMDNSIVKITDLNGNLIYQTKSLGGQATWNCQNRKGVRVASGIYLVLSATEDSKESVVTKIAIIK